MIGLGLWFLGAFGFAFVVGHSKISLSVREWLAGGVEGTDVPLERKPGVPVLGPFLVALAECPGCLGWWFGFAGGLLGVWVVPSWPLWGTCLLLAFATSAVNLLFAKYIGMI